MARTLQLAMQDDSEPKDTEAELVELHALCDKLLQSAVDLPVQDEVAYRLPLPRQQMWWAIGSGGGRIGLAAQSAATAQCGGGDEGRGGAAGGAGCAAMYEAVRVQSTYRELLRARLRSHAGSKTSLILIFIFGCYL
jgi:hypothetical protein